ncbi:LysR family transcriptional regulator [Gordonia sp. C13]|uniref:LysR family transcriptional regulator n=1 Tax=Gordonia sp. C13 TaxID=2935078 RepID=UPI00200ABF65|nr:LysR family transcriptional regulator [Gordonia sp. C13]MCK8613467.1 LysR family transcriptional regulator [Gordonia sp. C13]
MTSPDVDLLDTRRLHQFVVAVESETLSAAAQQLFLTQQALSASIRQLEREVDVTLFDRSRRKLHLTDAGNTLYAGARALLAGNTSLLTEVRESARGIVRPFVVGHSPAISGEEVYHLIAPAIASMPHQPITARQVFPGQLQELLFANEIDVALRRGVDSPANLTSAVFAYHELRIAVVADHLLAHRRSITARDLADTPIVVWAPERKSFYTDFLISYCRRAGFEPTLVVNQIQGTPPFTAVRRYPEACAFVTDVPGDLQGGTVRVLAFDEPPLAPVQAMWLPHTHSAVRDAIVSGGGG